MSKRQSVEVRVVEFFQDASLDVADSILEVVKSVMKSRHAILVPAAQRVLRKKRVRKALGAGVPNVNDAL